MKVYVVHAGSYSDRKVVAVYSDKAKAEEVQQTVSCENNLEEYELDRLGFDLPPGLKYYCVHIREDGQLVELYGDGVSLHPSIEFWSGGLAPMKVDLEYKYKDKHKIDGAKVRMRSALYLMWARDEKHAVKIANDQRAMDIANGKWNW